jgi:GNAT superfamily N-acetyltransferase
LAVERVPWERRLVDPAGWTRIAEDSAAALGTIHLTDARTERGEGKAIAGRTHISGLFVLPSSWDGGIGSVLAEAARADMRRRGYRKAQLFTAAANRRSRTFYERRGWRAAATDTYKHDDLWLASYERSLRGASRQLRFAWLSSGAGGPYVHVVDATSPRSLRQGVAGSICV